MFDTNRIRTVAGGPVMSDPEMLNADEEDVEALQSVFEYVTVIADSRFDEVVSVNPSVWDACVALATYQLQKHAQETRLVRNGRTLSALMVESLLRFGFVARCLDEALGIESKLDRSG
jgi:hypothetical protein